MAQGVRYVSNTSNRKLGDGVDATYVATEST